MKKSVLAFGATIIALSLSLTSCVSLVAGSILQATMSAGFDTSYSEKTDSDLVTVHIPIARIPNSAMVNITKATPRSGGVAEYSISVHYTSSVSLTRYESLRFDIDGKKFSFVGAPMTANTDLALAYLQGMVYDIGYSEAQGSTVLAAKPLESDGALAMNKAIVGGKSVSIKNFEAGSDRLVSYTLSESDRALFRKLL